MKNVIAFFIYVSIILFTVLFDVDGGTAIGTQIWPNVPAYVISFAEILGNIIWLFGTIFFIGAAACIFIALNMKEIMEDARGKKRIDTTDLNKLGKKSIRSYVSFSIAIPISLLAIGSGFWYTGTGWLAMLLGLIWLQAEFRKEQAEFRKEQAETK